MIRRIGVLLLVVTGFVMSPLSANADSSADDQRPTGLASGYAIVTLADPPTASYAGGIAGLARTKPDRGRLDPSSAAYRAYHRHLEQQHGAYRAYLAQRLPGAQVVREFFDVLNGFAVQLNGTQVQQLQAGPGVRAAGPSVTYRPTMNISRDLIRASEVWGSLGGEATAGSGVKVAIIDTGIDLRSPFFGDAGLAAQAQIDQCADQDNDPATPDTNNKVIVCRVFASGTAVEPGPPQAALELCVEHGTHVAGTVAGKAGTSGKVAGTSVVVSDLGGVAPGALLGNYNVFPCIGAGFRAFGGSAFSHDIAAALEMAVLDGMDVANMSLGGSVQGPHDFLAEAVDHAVDAGMVVAVAAGNEGPGDSTVASPGSAPNAITAGASTNPHFVGIPVSIGGGTTIGAALGEFANFDPAITAAYTTTSPAKGCTAITTALAGKIALIDRGTCTFTTKIRNAQTAGAVGVLVVNNVAGDPTAMAHDGTDPKPTIPAAMVGKAEGNAMKPSGTATVDGTTVQEILTANADIIAGFSSRGPTPFTALIKPDITAPGVNILSSVFGGEFAFFQGTSMATPHTAGAAALVRAGFPTATPAEVKSRLVNSASRTVTDHVNATKDPGVLARGGGRIDVANAFAATTFFAPVSVSFGEQRGRRPIDLATAVTVTGASATSASIVPFKTFPAGLSISASVSGGAVNVTLTATRDVPSGDYTGDVSVTSADGHSYLVPFFVRISR